MQCLVATDLVVWVKCGEITNTEDDLMQQFLRRLLRAEPDEVTGDVTELQGQAFCSKSFLYNKQHSNLFFKVYVNTW